MPEGEFLYEPKWNGFRALAFVDAPGTPGGHGGSVYLQSRNGKPLTRYSPR